MAVSADNDYERIVIEYSDMITRICILHTRDPESAKDCYQNTILKLLVNEPVFNSESHLKAWLIRVALNECNSIQRSSFRKKTVGFDLLENEFGYIEDNSLLAIVMKMNPIYKNPLYLYYYEKYTVSEIALILDEKENTIKTRLARGRAILKEELGDYDG